MPATAAWGPTSTGGSARNRLPETSTRSPTSLKSPTFFPGAATARPTWKASCTRTGCDSSRKRSSNWRRSDVCTPRPDAPLRSCPERPAMNRIFLGLTRGIALVLVVANNAASLSAGDVAVPKVILGVHGGTGVTKKEMTPQLEKDLRAGLERALKAGFAVLKKPEGKSLDAVETAIRVLEDDEWFNAGKGAVFTHDGRNELDASIMEGRTKKAGAVASVTNVKNPISAARAVMEKTKHVMLVGRGAEVFAREAGLEIVDPKYFWTQERWDELQKD